MSPTTDSYSSSDSMTHKSCPNSFHRVKPRTKDSHAASDDDGLINSSGDDSTLLLKSLKPLHQLPIPSADGVFNCTYEGCKSTFHKASKLNRHYLSHTTLRPFQCPNCDKTFRRREHLSVHQLTHAETDADRKPWACDYSGCSNRFVTKYHLSRHVSAVHLSDLPFKCTHTDCDAAFIKHTQLRTHMTIHTGTLAYPCNECDKSFPTPSKLKIHSLLHTPEAQSRYVCGHSSCEEAFSKWSALQTHNRTAHMSVCSICKRAFQTAARLRMHLKTHDLDREHFPCTWEEGCEKVFYSSKSRDIHIRVAHRRIFPFVCDFGDCKQVFAHKRSLNNHKKSHLDLPRPIKRLKTEPTEIDLLTGMSYIQERAIPCQIPICNFRFKRQYDLARHMLAIHGSSVQNNHDLLDSETDGDTGRETDCSAFNDIADPSESLLHTTSEEASDANHPTQL
ncbi:hypothetical protein BASA50_009657 [Batrachochytrium salamandrivorans]|uniref:C2H2-type domain-containing protein n=1 Tax=Batrachochytrium salamandrivorans TaxID=1357716 RepID=A0ABQ8F108_9FUNG|nr:hypothetical protein BASA60_005211 [Batrachochytrium salamandrivorans]KAH6589954.1 hypothetical protein BASA50_009657 [Batrachochytrium salamandrivorans]KAH9246922.1 hypothetical protein BASA81_015500 [Batrachochytrium salamandrivorans]